MNNIQRRAVVAGFIHALKESPDVRDKWTLIFSTRDWRGLRILIGETLGLAETPSEEDLEAMRIHSLDRLMHQLEELQQLDQRIEADYVLNGMYRPPPHH
jgi:hypothetical protein